MTRTIADLEGAEPIDTPHIAEGLQSRKHEEHEDRFLSLHILSQVIETEDAVIRALNSRLK